MNTAVTQPEEATRVSITSYWVIVLLWAAFYLPGLGLRDLRLEEPHRVEPALAMLQTGDWRQPTIGGEPYYKKPPLLNWLIASSVRLGGGFSETAARMPSVLMVLALALVGVATTRTWLGRGPAVGMGIICLTCTAMVDKGRLAEIDAPYAALTGMAMLVWLQGWAAGSVSAGRWALTGGLLGLGLLAKGPPHLLFFYGLVVVLLGLEGRWRELVRPGHALGILCIILPIGLWVLSVRAELLAARAIWADEMVARFAYLGDAKRALDALLGPVRSILNLVPWTLLLLARPWSEKADEPAAATSRFLRGALWYGVATLLVLPLIPGFRPRYAMPAYAVAFVLMAIWGERALPPSAAGRCWSKLLVGVAVFAVPVAFVSAGMNRTRPQWLVCAALAVVCSGWVWRSRERFTSPLARWHGSALALTAFALAAWGIAAPALARKAPLTQAAETVARQLADGERFVAYRPGYLPFLLYLRDRCDIVLDPARCPDVGVKLLTAKTNLPVLTATGRAAEPLAQLQAEGEAFVLVRLGPRP